MPPGTALTTESLAGVLGRVHEASILFPLKEAGDGRRDGRRFAQILLTLREVNGDGVMSGVSQALTPKRSESPLQLIF